MSIDPGFTLARLMRCGQSLLTLCPGLLQEVLNGLVLAHFSGAYRM